MFSLASGLLLGPVVGLTVALTATAASALLSFALARSLGRRMVARHLNRPRVRSVDERLTKGGWFAVASLRIIPPIPFLPSNYACGLSLRSATDRRGAALRLPSIPRRSRRHPCRGRLR